MKTNLELLAFIVENILSGRARASTNTLTATQVPCAGYRWVFIGRHDLRTALDECCHLESDLASLSIVAQARSYRDKRQLLRDAALRASTLSSALQFRPDLDLKVKQLLQAAAESSIAAQDLATDEAPSLRSHSTSQSAPTFAPVAPRTPHLLMHYLLPRFTRDALIGDALERFEEIMVPTFGLRAARRWFWWESLRSVAEMLPGRVWKFLLKLTTLEWFLRLVGRL